MTAVTREEMVGNFLQIQEQLRATQLAPRCPARPIGHARDGACSTAAR